MRNITWCPCLNTRLNLNIGINYVERGVVKYLWISTECRSLQFNKCLSKFSRIPFILYKYTVVLGVFVPIELNFFQ